MSAEVALVSRLEAVAGVTALVGQRIYPMVMPQEATLPAITYQRIATPRFRRLTGAATLTRPLIQVSCWAETYTGAKGLAAAVVSALDGHGDVMTVSGELDLLEQDGLRHRVLLEVAIWN